MEQQDILGQLGLGKHEAVIYLALLRRGEATAVTLAKECTLHRRTVYDTIESLKRQGLVTVKLKKSVQHFAPADPRALQSLLDERQAMLKGLLPSLLTAYNAKRQDVSVQIYEGASGMRTVFHDLLRTSPREEVVMIGAGLKAPTHLKYTYNHFLNELNRLRWRLIEPDIPWIRKEMASWKVPRSYRFLPAKYLSPLSITVYADKLIILLMEPEPLLIQITGKHYAKAFRNYFELLWLAAKK